MATCNGLFKTNNALEPNPSLVNWSIINVNKYISDLEYLPNSNRLIVVLATDGNTSSDCFDFEDNSASFSWNTIYTDDGGIVWNNINGSNKPSMLNLKFQTIETTNANNNIVYLQQVSSSGQGSLYKYNFTSDSWSLQSNFGNVGQGKGHGFGVSDLDENKVAVACCGFYTDRYKISTNGGITWNYPNLSNALEYHVDIEDFVFHPINDNLYMTNHGGVHLSSDDGQHWQSMNIDLGVSTVSAFYTSENDPSFMTAGLYHGGTIRTFQSPYNPFWVPTWQTIFGGDGKYTLIDEPYVYITTQCGFYRSANNGAPSTFSTKTPSPFLDGTDEITNFCFEKSPIFNSQDKSTIYMVGQRKNSGGTVLGKDVIRSVNKGDNWEVISNFGLGMTPSPTDYIVWKLASAPTNKNVLYAFVDFAFAASPSSNKIFKTTNANDNSGSVIWEEVNHPFNLTITAIEVDVLDPNVIYITYNNNFNGSNKLVYQINSSGFTDWDPNNNLKKLNTSRLVLEKGSNGGMYLSTDVGVYYRNNFNNNWIFYGTGLPHVLTSGLEIDYNSAKLRIATFGRGIWEINLECPADMNLTESGTYAVDFFKEAQNNIESTAIINPDRTITYRAGNEIHLKEAFQSFSGSEFHALIHPCKD